MQEHVLMKGYLKITSRLGGLAPGGRGGSDPDAPAPPGLQPTNAPCTHRTHEHSAETVKCCAGSSPVQPAHHRGGCGPCVSHTHTHRRGSSAQDLRDDRGFSPPYVVTRASVGEVTSP